MTNITRKDIRLAVLLFKIGFYIWIFAGSLFLVTLMLGKPFELETLPFIIVAILFWGNNLRKLVRGPTKHE